MQASNLASVGSGALGAARDCRESYRLEAATLATDDHATERTTATRHDGSAARAADELAPVLNIRDRGEGETIPEETGSAAAGVTAPMVAKSNAVPRP